MKKQLTEMFSLTGSMFGTWIIQSKITNDEIKVRGYNTACKARRELERKLISKISGLAFLYPDRVVKCKDEINALEDMYGKKWFNF